MGKLNKKQFLVLLIVWFVIAYLLMWFFGGACMSLFVSPNTVGDVCVASGALQGLRSIPVIGFFIPYNEWISIMYWFAPIAGFVLALVVMKWWNNYFETKEATSIFFLLIMIVILLAGFYINLSWYYGEIAANNSRNDLQVALYFCFDNDGQVCNNTVSQLNQEYVSQAQKNNSTKVTQLLMVNYWAELRESIFLLFILGALVAWLPLFVKQKIEEKEDKK